MPNSSGSSYHSSTTPHPYYPTSDPYHSPQQAQYLPTAHPSHTVPALHPSALPSPYIYQPFPPEQAAAPMPSLPTFPSIPQGPIERTETVAKNYVVHELEQEDGAPRPLWKDTMAAMFGDHVKWEELRVYVARNRPWTRPVLICPITGQPAKYLDPRTSVPFANLHGYRTISQILRHEFVWDAVSGCYTGYAGRQPEPAEPLPESEPLAQESEPATTTRKRGKSTAAT